MATATLERVGVHPLDPLSAEEIERASALAAEHLGGRCGLAPLPAGRAGWSRDKEVGCAASRRATLLRGAPSRSCFDTASGLETFEAVVDLAADAVESCDAAAPTFSPSR